MPHVSLRAQGTRQHSARPLILTVLALLSGTAGLLAPVPAASGAEVLSTALTIDSQVPASAKVGARLTVTGQVRARLLGGALSAGEPGRTVSVQVASDRGWRTVSTTRTSATGRFTLPAPTYYAGRHRYRIEVAGTLLRQATASSTRTLRVSLRYRPAGRARAWSRLAEPGVRWDPCRTIPFYVNTAGAPRNARPLVTRALRELSRASGLRFRYAGRTSLVPWRTGISPERTFPAYGIAVAWSTGRAVRSIAGSPIGYGGPWLETTYPGGVRRTAAVAGGVVVDRDYRLAPRFGTGRTLGWVLMHELAHVLGLGHSDDRRQLMHGSLSDTSQTRLGAGDVAGLRALGADRGCL